MKSASNNRPSHTTRNYSLTKKISTTLLAITRVTSNFSLPYPTLLAFEKALLVIAWWLNINNFDTLINCSNLNWFASRLRERMFRQSTSSGNKRFRGNSTPEVVETHMLGTTVMRYCFATWWENSIVVSRIYHQDRCPTSSSQLILQIDYTVTQCTY